MNIYHQNYSHIGPSLTTQKGVSLISLMIGLLVSVVTVVSTLSIYKNLTQISVDSTFDAKAAGDLANAALRIQLEVQSAGFGLPEPTAASENHIGFVAASGTTTPAIFWRERKVLGEATVECHRIVEQIAEQDDIPNNTEGGFTGKKLVQQTLNSDDTPALCNASNQLSALADNNWNDADSQQIISVTVMTRLDQDFAKAAAVDANLFEFSVEPLVSCAPFGMVEASERAQVVIRHTDAAAINNSAAGSDFAKGHIYRLCIANQAVPVANAAGTATPDPTTLVTPS